MNRRRSSFWQRIPTGPHPVRRVEILPATESERAEHLSDAEAGSAALLRAIKVYLAKYQPGARI